MTRTVTVVRTGTANLASVLAALTRAGATPELSDDPRAVEAAGHVVLPGVGSFAAAMEGLRAAKLVEPLAARVEAGRPTLSICLGFQLLGLSSEESPGESGLGALAYPSLRFDEHDPEGNPLRVPHLGWNEVVPDAGCRLLTRGFAYFAHSFYVAEPPADWSAGRTEYGSRFVSALERGDVLACQFHPELSGAWGQALIRAWVEARPRDAATARAEAAESAGAWEGGSC